MGTAILCIAAIGFLHRSLDGVHILCAIFFITFQLVPNSNATFDIAVNTDFLEFVVVTETVGKFYLRAPLGDTPPSSSKETRGLSDRGPDAVQKVRGPRSVFEFAQIADEAWNRGEVEVDNSGTVGLLRSLSLPKNHRKAFATAV